MINSSPPQSSTLGSEEERVDAIVRSGPGGAIAVAGIATAIVEHAPFGSDRDAAL